jgi:hypothetical protein
MMNERKAMDEEWKGLFVIGGIAPLITLVCYIE